MSSKCCENKHVDLLLTREGEKLLEQKTYWNIILKIALQLMVSKTLRCLQMVNTSNQRIVREK